MPFSLKAFFFQNLTLNTLERFLSIDLCFVSNMDVSIILPTYNEKDNIAVFIPKIEELMERKGYTFEIIIVDDESPDGTAEKAKELHLNYGNIKVITPKKRRGIGAALRRGYNAGSGDILLSSDADLSFSATDMLRLIDTIKNGSDLVVGSRHISEKSYHMPNFKIKCKGFISLYGNKIVRLFSGLPVHDTSANFRAIRKKVWKEISTKEKTNSLLLEMIMASHYSGYKITEIPVVFKDRLHGTSKLNLLKEAPKFFVKLLEFTIRYRIFSSVRLK
jgi:dolichol-phosphate mannosyltransferase